ncbi:PREDICTED: hornerin-like [Condylura cristata]|uniref:hornerin-like n=1 Tax=Condylura cristata TaxID=143302 RepID=UPI0006434507|nr:PREDICTED: hornerin-like [Condylura cristata]
MPKLVQSMVTVIDVFYEYASQDEECNMLKKEEMKALLENEFHQILKNPDDPDTVDIIMQSLDRDHNKKVDFTEYLLMIFKLAQACNKMISKDYCQASGSKQRDHRHWHHKEQNETEDEDKRQEKSSTRSKKQKDKQQRNCLISGHRQSTGERRDSSSGYLKDNKKNKNGSHQQGFGSEDVSDTHSSDCRKRSNLANQDGKKQIQNLNQENVKNKDTVRVLVTVMENIVHAQVAPLVRLDISHLAVAKLHQVQANHLV